MTAAAVPNHHTRAVVASLALFALLAIVHTWPLAAAPATWSRVDGADAALNTWAVSWVGSHLLRDPLHLFDANIFYPERLTLAYSEAMIVQGAIAAPVIELGGSPVLAYNVSLLAGFTLTGWAFCLLVRHWTHSWSAGCIAGSLAAFNAHALVRFGHLQALHPEFFALMLFALDRLITARRLSNAWWLAIGFALQGLTSIYMLVFSVWTLLFALVSRGREILRADAAAVLVRLAAAGIVAGLLLTPYLSAYWQLRADSGLGRTADEQIAGSWQDYLATGARVHAWWVPDDAARSLAYGFPGVTAVVLVAVGVSRKAIRRDPRFVMCAAAAAGCVLVSMAPRMPFYSALHGAIPLFQAVRVPALLSQQVLLMVAVLAGFGAAAIETRWRSARTWPAMAVVLVLLVNLEALRAPIGFTRFDGVPAVYEALAHERDAVVVEVPFPIPQQWFLNGRYMVNSTKHWRPMLNGYSGFKPASYEKSYEAARAFPAPESLIALHERGVTHVVVHRTALGPDRVAQIQAVHELQEIASDDDIAIYRIRTP